MDLSKKAPPNQFVFLKPCDLSPKNVFFSHLIRQLRGTERGKRDLKQNQILCPRAFFSFLVCVSSWVW